MSRQEQINKMARGLAGKYLDIKVFIAKATYLVDSGFGDKDRFELREGLTFRRGQNKLFIKPIGYKEE